MKTIPDDRRAWRGVTLQPAGACAGARPRQRSRRARRCSRAVTLPAAGAAKLTVTTPGWKDGADIDFKYTQYQGNDFPWP